MERLYTVTRYKGEPSGIHTETVVRQEPFLETDNRIAHAVHAISPVEAKLLAAQAFGPDLVAAFCHSETVTGW